MFHLDREEAPQRRVTHTRLRSGRGGEAAEEETKRMKMKMMMEFQVTRGWEENSSIIATLPQSTTSTQLTATKAPTQNTIQANQNHYYLLGPLMQHKKGRLHIIYKKVCQRRRDKKNKRHQEVFLRALPAAAPKPLFLGRDREEEPRPCGLPLGAEKEEPPLFLLGHAFAQWPTC